MKRIWIGLLAISLFVACDELDQILNEDLTTAEIVEGLKEALSTGISTSVTSASAADGYLKNEIIKVLLPDEVAALQETVTTGSFTKLGVTIKYQTIMDVYVAATPGLDTDPFEELIVAMNRGAESAATKAKPIFKDALTSMSFADALEILQGNDSSATSYFQTNTQTALKDAFLPDVTDALNQTKANAIYSDVAGFLNYTYETSILGVPVRLKVSDFLEQTIPESIDEYATEKAIGGLFHLVGQEEKKIRANPLDYVSAIIQKVFGSKEANGG